MAQSDNNLYKVCFMRLNISLKNRSMITRKSWSLSEVHIWAKSFYIIVVLFILLALVQGEKTLDQRPKYVDDGSIDDEPVVRLNETWLWVAIGCGFGTGLIFGSFFVVCWARVIRSNRPLPSNRGPKERLAVASLYQSSSLCSCCDRTSTTA